MDSAPQVPGWVEIVAGAFGFIFLGVVLLIVVAGVRSARALRRAGLDPLAAEAQLVGRVANTAVLRESRSLEERLAELDEMHSRGVISDDEHAQARLALLAGA